LSNTTFHFFIEEVDFTLQNEKEIASWLTQIAKDENQSISNIEYILCSDDYLLQINKEHLNHDYYTDIITFPLANDPLEATIFISVDRIKENAENFDQTFRDELHRVIAHGLLHLLGFNDKTEEQAKVMRKMENLVLTQRPFL